MLILLISITYQLESCKKKGAIGKTWCNLTRLDQTQPHPNPAEKYNY